MKFFHTITRFAAAMALLLLCSVGIAQAQWEQMQSVPGGPDRWGSAGVYYNGKIYLFGGVTNNSLASGNATYVLDVSAQSPSWSTAANMFAATYNHSGTLLNNRIYIFGGQNGNQQIANFFTTASSFDPVGGNFRQEPTMPRASTNAATVAVGTKAYLIGGLTLVTTPQGTSLGIPTGVLVFDAMTNTWSEIANGAPYAAYGMMAATGPDGTIYVAGGQNAQGQGYTSAYKGTVNGNSITWTPIANLPTVVAAGGMSFFDGKPMVAGGISTGDNFRGAYIYDAANNKWDSFYQLAVPHPAGVLVGDGTNPYMIAGAGTNTVEKAIKGEPVAVANITQTDVFLSAKPGTQVSGSISAGNGGVAALTINATVPGDASWLTVPSVTVNASSVGTVNFNANAASLAQGTYKTTVTLNTNDENKPTHMVNVYLFVGDAQITQQPQIVLEEGSGDWCGWCPNGHDKIVEAEAVYGERLTVLSYHGGSQTEPLMISEGVQVLNKLGLGGFPNGAVQRITFPGQSAPMVGVSTTGNAWKDLIDFFAASVPVAPAEVMVENYEFNPVTREVTADVKVKLGTWVKPDEVYLTAVVTQDGIYTSQVDYVNGDHASYEQSNAVRYVWPNSNGEQLEVPEEDIAFGYAPPTAEIQKSVSITIPQQTGLGNFEIKPADCKITFLVHVNPNNQLGPILQAYERELVGGVTGPAVTINFPNQTSKEIAPQQTAEFAVEVTNNRNEAVEVMINRAQNDLPNGWTSEICTGAAACDDRNQVIFSIPANTTHTFMLKVTGTTAGQSGNVRLVFSAGDIVQDETFTVNTTTSSVAVPGEVRGLSMTEITPNPASSVAHISVSIPNGAQTVLEVYSITGQKVATLFEGRLEAGNRQIDANVSSLESGKYVLVLTSGDKKVSRSLTIVR